MSSVEILEVAPRDGFQAVKPFIPTEAKIALIEELAACGFKRLEIGSFVSPKAMPQLADTRRDPASARGCPRACACMVLVPNAKGLELALDAGVKEVSWVISVSESHNRANVNRSVDESFKAFRGGLGRARQGPAEAAARPLHLLRLPVGGPHARGQRDPRRGARASRGAGCRDRHLRHDGPRRARPCGLAVRPHHAALRQRRVTFAYHGHDTYGLGVANAIEAYRQGVRVIDGAAGGLGGCPFAPGAAGNTASEDLVFAFEHMGVDTGIDFAKLLVAADRVARRRRPSRPAARCAPCRAAGAVGLRPCEPRRAGLRGGCSLPRGLLRHSRQPFVNDCVERFA